jgi:hypothetical protein
MNLSTAFPAKTGIQRASTRRSRRVWIPAFAGKTEEGKQGTHPHSCLTAQPMIICGQIADRGYFS